MISLELQAELDEIKRLIKTNIDATLQCLSYFEQLSDLYEQLRIEHAKNHGHSILPIQIRRKVR